MKNARNTFLDELGENLFILDIFGQKKAFGNTMTNTFEKHILHIAFIFYIIFLYYKVKLNKLYLCQTNRIFYWFY
jgi:hypothetical protein